VKLSDWLAGLGLWLKAHPDLTLPLLLSLGIAICDLRTRRIPNYLTLTGVLGGLGFQLGYHGLSGFLDGVAGSGLGFILLLGPYLLGGLGACDVKASAALGAWLGLWRAAALFVYMGVSGGVIMLVVLLWQGRLRAGIKEIGNFLLNWLLCRPFDSKPPPPASFTQTTFPYGAALALGMAVLVWRLA
jgi:prepilin peptidase CpaA